MSDEAAAYWSETLKTVSETDAWKTEYIEANKLIPNYMDTATATEYVTCLLYTSWCDRGYCCG